MYDRSYARLQLRFCLMEQKERHMNHHSIRFVDCPTSVFHEHTFTRISLLFSRLLKC